jgi:hypothetical protein
MSDTSTQGGYQPPAGTTPEGEGTDDVQEPQEVNTEEQEAQRQKVLEEGRFAATEGDDNPIAVSDEDFIGVAPEYKEYVSDTLTPYAAEEGPEKELEERAKEHEKNLLEQSTTGNNRTGYSTKGLVHPSEKKQPSADLIDKQRAVLDRQAGTTR